jgi:hypothetical protein
MSSRSSDVVAAGPAGLSPMGTRIIATPVYRSESTRDECDTGAAAPRGGRRSLAPVYSIESNRFHQIPPRDPARSLEDDMRALGLDG